MPRFCLALPSIYAIQRWRSWPWATSRAGSTQFLAATALLDTNIINMACCNWASGHCPDGPRPSFASAIHCRLFITSSNGFILVVYGMALSLILGCDQHPSMRLFQAVFTPDMMMVFQYLVYTKCQPEVKDCILAHTFSSREDGDGKCFITPCPSHPSFTFEKCVGLNLLNYWGQFAH